MTHTPLYKAMGLIAAVGGSMMAGGSIDAVAQHNYPAGCMVNYMPCPQPVAFSSDNALCQHVLMTYPSDHLLLSVKQHPEIQIHCGDNRSQTPVHITFNRMVDLDWYRVHPGHRDVTPGETDND